MKTSHKGLVAPLLLALIAVLLIGGGVYVYMQDKQVKQSAVVGTTTQATSTNTTKISDSKESSLPRYFFEDFPFLTGGERQINLEGIFAPTNINLGEYAFSESNVTIRCWEKDMVCVFGGIRGPNEYTDYSKPWVALLKVTQWNDKQLIISGGVGFYPDCQRDACGQDVDIIVDISDRLVRLTHKRCFVECAEDKYILVGTGDGKHQIEADIPKPAINIKPII
ncbi:MAG: hypothetical protein Q7R59_01060 [bacterium]|nr:hypothetical protein [bacterium]